MSAHSKPFHPVVKACLGFPAEIQDDDCIATLRAHPRHQNKPCLELRFCPYEALVAPPRRLAWCESGKLPSQNTAPPAPSAEQACFELTHRAAGKTRQLFELLGSSTNEKAP